MLSGGERARQTMSLTLLEEPTGIFGSLPDGTRSARDWLAEGFRVPKGTRPRAVLLNVLTHGPHARRRPLLVPEDRAEMEWLNVRGLHPEAVYGTPLEQELREVRRAARAACNTQ